MTNKMTHTVIGLFDSRNDAEKASQDLVKNGFALENLDVSNKKTGEKIEMNKPANTSNESVGDSISNFFSSMFGSDTPEAKNYSNVAGQTEAILTVQTDSAEKAKKAADILDKNGAVDVNERAARNQQNFAQKGKTNQSDMKIPVMEENLQVGKREVETGGARIRSRIVEKPVEESIRLRQEHVMVNRQPVNRAVTDADMANFKEGDIEITERGEEPVVSKQARVTEEVSIGKNVTERDQVVKDTVRHTEVDVEKINQDTNAKKAKNQ
ncbi:MAG: DUF2382 domain-containing protein [Pyrinomonadaceae bacterium]